jgi:hypothetical protein
MRPQRHAHQFHRFPGAAQHEVVRCRPGIVLDSACVTIPDQRCTGNSAFTRVDALLRCTASGKRFVGRPTFIAN